MKTAGKILKETSEYNKWLSELSYSEEITLLDMMKEYATELCHVLANDVIRQLPKNSGSNDVSDYVTKWLKDNMK